MRWACLLVVAAGCATEPLSVRFAYLGGGRFEGKADVVVVQLDNQPDNAQLDSFPEAPLRIVRTDLRTSCEITDGGIWIRDSFRVSRDGQTLSVLAFSGSNTWVERYETKSCRRVAGK